MDKNVLNNILDQRAFAEGGFRLRPDGDFRADATAWAAIALKAAGISGERLDAPLSRLAREQFFEEIPEGSLS